MTLIVKKETKKSLQDELVEALDNELILRRSSSTKKISKISFFEDDS